jgi:hypothetical protein
MADATFTTVVARVDQQLTNAIWEDQIRDNLNQLAGAHQNLLVNGGFDIWQRGAGPFTADAAYTADRWLTSRTGASTLQIDRESSIIDSSLSLYSAKLTAVFGTTCRLVQGLGTDWESRFANQTISFSARVRQGTASGIRLAINDGFGATNGSTSATTGSFITMGVTKTMGSTVSGALIYFDVLVSGTYYVDNAMLVIGPDPAPFRMLHPQEELARCQRYYEVHGGVNNAMGLNAYQAAGANFGQIVQFAVHKGGVPTVTKNGTWGVVNCGQPAISAPSKDGYTLFATTTALGACSFGNNSTDDTVTAEWNS